MIFRLLIIAFATFVSAQGVSQSYPNRPVRVINPFPAGGPVDVVARPLLERLRQEFDQPFVMENRPGAGGNIGAVYVAKSKPDGYTLMLTADSAYVINPSLYKNAGFDPLKDFEPVAPVATAGYVLVANNNFPANNTAELISLAKPRRRLVSPDIAEGTTTI